MQEQEESEVYIGPIIQEWIMGELHRCQKDPVGYTHLSLRYFLMDTRSPDIRPPVHALSDEDVVLGLDNLIRSNRVKIASIALDRNGLNIWISPVAIDSL